MNLDLDTLREMISSTLNEMTAGANISPETKAAAAAEQAAKMAKMAADEATQEKEEAEASAEEEKRQANLSSEMSQEESSALEESFQITKGRLRQIIAEELISAKKQGIL